MKRLSLILGVMTFLSLAAFADSSVIPRAQGYTLKAPAQIIWMSRHANDNDNAPAAIYMGSAGNMMNDSLVPNSLIFQPNDPAARP